MINIKISKNEDGYITSVCSQGHANADVCAAVSALTQSCGRQLESMKSAKISMNEKDGFYLIQDIRKGKPALAVVDALVNGLESIERQNKYSVQIQWLWAE